MRMAEFHFHPQDAASASFPSISRADEVLLVDDINRVSEQAIFDCFTPNDQYCGH